MHGARYGGVEREDMKIHRNLCKGPTKKSPSKNRWGLLDFKSDPHSGDWYIPWFLNVFHRTAGHLHKVKKNC